MQGQDRAELVGQNEKALEFHPREPEVLEPAGWEPTTICKQSLGKPAHSWEIRIRTCLGAGGALPMD